MADRRSRLAADLDQSPNVFGWQMLVAESDWGVRCVAIALCCCRWWCSVGTCL